MIQKISNYIKKQEIIYSQIVQLDLIYFIKSSLWTSFSLVLITIGGLILSSLFARIWPPEIYGQFTFLLSIVSFISLTSLPGLNLLLTQEISKGYDGFYKKSIATSFRWSIIGVTFLIFGALYFYFTGNVDLSFGFIAFAISFPLAYGLNLYLAFLNGKNNFKIYSLFSFFSQSVPITATALSLLFFPNFVFIVFVSSLAAGLTNLILTLMSLKYVKNKKIKNKQNFFSFSKKLSFSNLLYLITDYVDKFLIPILLGYNALAIYTFATIIPNQLHNFFKVFLTIGQPKIAKLSSKNLKRSLFLKCIQLEVIIIVIIAMYIVSAPIIFTVLYPNYKESATHISQLFSLSLLYFPINLLGIANTHKRSTKSIYLSNIIFAVSTIIPLIILTPLFGIIGVVISKIISRIITIIFNIVIFKKLYH